MEDIVSTFKFPYDGKPLARTMKHLAAIDTQALAFACMKAAGRRDIPVITVFDIGGFNMIFQASFGQDVNIIIRVPLNMTSDVVASTVATMTYARYVMNIPSPAVLAWNGQEDNPVGLPYTIMEKCNGVRLDTIFPNDMHPREQIVALRKLTELYFKTTAPQPFLSYGRLRFAEDCTAALSDPSSYCITSFVQNVPGRVDDTFIPSNVGASDNIKSIWTQAFYAHRAAMEARWGTDDPEALIDDPNWNVQVRLRASGVKTWGDAQKIAKQLLHVIQETDIPPLAQENDLPGYSDPCLVNADFAFRNVMYDKSTREVVALLDWDDAAILPAVLINHFPQDLVSPVQFIDEGEGTEKRGPLSCTSPFRFKPSNWYNDLDVNVKATQITMSEVTYCHNVHMENKKHAQSLFVNMLRLWGFGGNKYHIIQSGDGATRQAEICFDALRIHNLLLAGYLHWCIDKDWLEEKASKLETGKMAIPEKEAIVPTSLEKVNILKGGAVVTISIVVLGLALSIAIAYSRHH